MTYNIDQHTQISNEFFQEVCETVKRAFGGDLEKFSFEVNEDNLRLVWKKTSGKIKQRVAEMNLKAEDYQTELKSMMEFLVTENKEMKSTNRDLQRRQVNMRRCLEQHQSTLELFEKEKNELEDRLYSRILPILNAKKGEILRLQKLLKRVPETEVAYGEDVDTDVEDEEGEPDIKRQKLSSSSQ